MKKFKQMTSNNNFLSEVFDDKDKDVSIKTKQFLKIFRFCLGKSFEKMRVKQTKHNKALEALFNRIRNLRTKSDEDSVHALEDVDRQLSEMCAEENARIIKDTCGGLTCETGGINVGKLWHLKKKLKCVLNDPPSAMLDQYGNLVTSSKGLEELTLDIFKERLKTLKIREDMRLHQLQRETLCQIILKRHVK